MVVQQCILYHLSLISNCTPGYAGLVKHMLGSILCGQHEGLVDSCFRRGFLVFACVFKIRNVTILTASRTMMREAVGILLCICLGDC